MAKVTLATIKSFVRKNRDALYIRTLSSFDGMTDCVQPCDNREFRKAEAAPEHMTRNTLGVRGAWFVFDSRDYFTPISENGFIGYHVYNCCGSFDLAVKQEANHA